MKLKTYQNKLVLRGIGLNTHIGILHYGILSSTHAGQDFSQTFIRCRELLCTFDNHSHQSPERIRYDGCMLMYLLT